MASVSSKTYKNSICQIENPYHMLVNKEYTLSPDYVPENLVRPNVRFASSGNLEKNYMEAEAARALEEMFSSAKKQDIQLVAVSGYRSYSRQRELYNQAIRQYGKNQQGTAMPGTSEHQTGLAMDINSVSQSFAYTKEGKWLAQNAHTYGFIIRYPQGKTSITGIIYEPWHVRYVGQELAERCYRENKTLEEIEICCYHETPMLIELDGKVGNSYYNIRLIEGVSYIKARDLVNRLNLGLSYTSNSVQLLGSNSVEYTETSLLKKMEGNYYVPLRQTLDGLGYTGWYIEADRIKLLGLAV